MPSWPNVRSRAAKDLPGGLQSARRRQSDAQRLARTWCGAPPRRDQRRGRLRRPRTCHQRDGSGGQAG